MTTALVAGGGDPYVVWVEGGRVWVLGLGFAKSFFSCFWPRVVVGGANGVNE